MWIFKAALEAAGKADRAAVAKALRKMDLTDGPARYFPGGRVKFDENGPARGREPADRAVAERHSDHGLSAEGCARRSDLAEAVTRNLLFNHVFNSGEMK